MRNPRYRTKEKSGQALLEISIWGILLLIAASYIASYILYLVYTQDLMIRNFRSAMRFAAQAGRTGEPVFHVMVEHRPIPSLLPNRFAPGYKEIINVATAIWSWNMYWKESENDPPYSVVLVKYIVDGENIAKKVVKNPKNHLLPENLKGKNFFFVMSLSPTEYLSSEKDSVLNPLKDAVGENDPLYKDVAAWFNKFDDDNKFEDLSQEDRDNALSELSQLVSRVNARGIGVVDDVNIAKKLNDIHDFLKYEKWKGDIDRLDQLLNRDYTTRSNLTTKIEVRGDKGQVDVTGDYTISKNIDTNLGTYTINWEAGETHVSW